MRESPIPVRSSGQKHEVLGTIDRLFRCGTASGLSDGQLLELFASRHDEAAEAAFATLVERHGPMVSKLCGRLLSDPHDAQDAFQATFLVLMRKASSVRRRESLAAWLYGVARRVSVRARSDSARRKAVEDAAARDRPSVVDRGTDERDRELWEEVDRLPAPAREAVVLCYLEGLTHEQAAARLGWPVGTVRSRLARARDRLRDRLERRGYAPAVRGDAVAGLLAFAARPGFDPISPRLVRETARAALTLTARDAVASGLVSESASALTQGVLRTMLFLKIKTVALATLACGTLAMGAAAYSFPQEDAPRESAIARVESAPYREEFDTVDIVGGRRAPVDAKKLADEAKDIAERIRKLTAEAVELQGKGELDRAQRTLREVERLTADWSSLLSRQQAGDAEDVLILRRGGDNPFVRVEPAARAPLFERRVPPPARVVGAPIPPRPPVAPAAPAAPPAPPAPPVAPDAPEPASVDVVSVPRASASTPARAVRGRAAEPVRAREVPRVNPETERRLDEIEKTVRQILNKLESKDAKAEKNPLAKP
ncbi:MAG: RNA polymerase sigma factor [Isosphaeraceae bacterium]